MLYLLLNFILKENSKKFNNFEWKTLGIFFLFFICSLISFVFFKLLYNKELSFIIFSKLLIKFLLQSAIVFLISRYFIKKNSVNKLIYILILLVSVSAIVAFCQFLGFSFFWKIKFFLTTDVANYINKFITSHNDRTRAVGLSLYFIPLSYETLLVFPLSLFMLFEKHFKKKILFFPVIIILLGILSSKTDSAYLALSVICLLLLLKKRNLFLIILAIPVLILMTVLFYHKIDMLICSLKERLGFWTVALFTLFHNPTGLPFLRHYVEYSSRYYPSAKIFGSIDIVGSYPHNQFLNTLIAYGMISIIPYIIFMLLIFRNKSMVNNRLSWLLKINLVGYFVNSFFHNLGPFYNDVFFWIIVSTLYI